MRRFAILYGALLAALLAACSGAEAPSSTDAAAASTLGDSGGAVSVAKPPAPMTPKDVLAGTVWPDAALGDGVASISCSADYDAGGDGQALAGLDYFHVLDAMEPCRESGVLRLHYAGKVDAGFVDLMERSAAMAERMGIRSRVLDIDSAGGHIEQGIRAGDAIGNSGWTLWVREDAVCHSACVLILAAADNRIVSGKVGIHRMLRIGSQATTRAELNAELRGVHQQLSDYLQRNGAAVAVADLMMTVPSRDLRMLTPEELRLYGLEGANAVQQDLERVTLLRECGEDFVRRREGFMRSFEEQCGRGEAAIDDKNACARELLPRFGFPDGSCAAHTPMAEIGGQSAGDAGSGPLQGTAW
ncbi:MAG: hypothetical protein Q4F49_06595 [Pseudoxanthomonas suwonensis]|nr:hypothetical protein [Pseudoxanthomonas suwonensis]